MFDAEKTPLSIEQAINYRESGDFKKNLRAKGKEFSGNMPIMYGDKGSQYLWLRKAVSLLDEKKGLKNCVYKPILQLRLKGATYKQIARHAKKSVKEIKQLETEALEAVKDMCTKSKIIPVFR